MTKTNPFAPIRKSVKFYPKEFTDVAFAEPETGLPEGSIKEILDWVDNDPQNASIALDHEKENKNRKTLVVELQAILKDAVGA